MSKKREQSKRASRKEAWIRLRDAASEFIIWSDSPSTEGYRRTKAEMIAALEGMERAV